LLALENAALIAPGPFLLTSGGRLAGGTVVKLQEVIVKYLILDLFWRRQSKVSDLACAKLTKHCLCCCRAEAVQGEGQGAGREWGDPDADAAGLAGQDIPARIRPFTSLLHSCQYTAFACNLDL
jgi:hypothetical protein